MKKFHHIILLTLGLCLMGQTSWASKAFVTDSFRISLRRGPSLENKILKFIPSGLPVEILESQDGWSYIHLSAPERGNMRGWVLSRYLITRLPWEDQAKSLIKETSQLEKRLTSIDNEWKKVLKQDTAKYLKLKAAHEIDQKTIQALSKENEALINTQRNNWFALGALVLLCGMMIGFVIGRRQKKSRESSYF